MKILIQRSRAACVRIDGEISGEIPHGLVLFVGVEKHDTQETLARMAKKVLAYRVFADAAGKMNLNVAQVGGGLLVISQFTLAANTQKGLRPSFSEAAPPERAEALYHDFVNILQAEHPLVATGKFGADMQVSLTNDGPVTFILQA